MALLTQIRKHGLLILVASCVTAVLASLGLWQLDRAAQKKRIMERIEARAQTEPRTVAELLAVDDPRHWPVADTGRFDNDRSILRDNRLLEGRAGYHLLTPFHTRSGHWVLVNRGWLPRGPSRDQLPEIPKVSGRVTIRGHVHINRGALVLDESEHDGGGWPLRVQRIDRAALARRLGVELAPFIVRLAPGTGPQAGAGLPRVWPERRMGPDRHYAYALQWFAMAAIAPWLFFWAARRRNNESDIE